MSFHEAPYLANPQRVAAEVMAAAIAPPPPIDYNAWAVDNVVFGSESRFKGPYNPDRFPFFARILVVLGPDHPAREIVFKKSAQLGGTVIAQIFAGAAIDLDPGPFLYVHPTENNGVRWARTKWRPMIRQCDALRGLFGSASTREGGNSVLYQERRDGLGFIQISGANSEASLSMISVPRQVQDDLSKWEMNNAGDPETQADSRSKAFDWAKILKIGTPLIEDNCRVTKAFARSTREHYHVPCPHCGHRHPLDWDNMRTNLEAAEARAKANDEDVEAAVAAAACFTCPSCGADIEEHHRTAMLAEGCWVAHRPGALMVGFYLWTAYSPLESWASIALQWVRSKGDPKSEQTFENDYLGRAYKAAGESPPWEEIKKRADRDGHRRGVVPRGGLLLVLGIDCQDDRVEWHLKAFGRDLQRWTIEYGVIDGHVALIETQAELDKLIGRAWPDFQNGARGLDLAAIDGGAYTQDVFDWVKRHPASKVIMVRGIDGDAAPPLAVVKRERTRDGRVRKYQRRFFNVGQAGIKFGLYKMLAVDDPLARGYCAYPAGMPDDFYEQLTAERRRPVRRKDGFVQYRWMKKPGQANEVLDTEVYAEAGAFRLGWRSKSPAAWDDLEAEREAPPAGGQLDIEDMLAPGASRTRPQTAQPAQTAARSAPIGDQRRKEIAERAARFGRVNQD